MDNSSFGWFLKLCTNCVGYSFVVVPAFFIYKYTSKINYLERCGKYILYYKFRKICLLKLRNNKFLFVVINLIPYNFLIIIYVIFSINWLYYILLSFVTFLTFFRLCLFFFQKRHLFTTQ